MKVQPIPDATFALGLNVRVYSNFASLFRVMKDYSSAFF